MNVNLDRNLGLDLKQIYLYYVNHPLCKFRGISFPIFENYYTLWINKN